MIRTAIVLALTVLCLLNVSRAMAIERSELQLASVNAAVAYADDEGLVYGKNADRRVPIASITKLMTALVVMESGEPLTEWLDFRERHIPAPANAYTRIRVSSELRRSDVLRIALMSSENFAAHTLSLIHI